MVCRIFPHVMQFYVGIFYSLTKWNKTKYFWKKWQGYACSTICFRTWQKRRAACCLHRVTDLLYSSQNICSATQRLWFSQIQMTMSKYHGTHSVADVSNYSFKPCPNYKWWETSPMWTIKMHYLCALIIGYSVHMSISKAQIASEQIVYRKEYVWTSSFATFQLWFGLAFFYFSPSCFSGPGEIMPLPGTGEPTWGIWIDLSREKN